MPLSAINFYAGGPIKAVDMLQFYNLFTGAMTDQPVTFANALMVGGSQAVGTVPLRVNSVAFGTANIVESRAVPGDTYPVFSVGRDGTVRLGAGGATAQDASVARAVGALILNGNTYDNAYTSWLPAATQGGINPTLNNVVSRYKREGLNAKVTANIIFTGAGDGSAQRILISTLPVQPFDNTAGTIYGDFTYTRQGVTIYEGTVVSNGATGVVAFCVSGQANYLGAAPQFAIGIGDLLQMKLDYPVG
jgi:hypothetical protein